ncbi:putative SWI/SNF-related matrix-associated actin-dependent regulator of chromatin subfamily A member 3-like protein 1 [Tanacetum coccineum]|uniref:SWI/SNF-related matrix-associated actin-dependent regulator of chromatin subfamily A member 3-like protein 1 n=1 Tax=Tanacetum coccineum TaxID=301880 RepID=A0ABQ5FNY3_9ASTR
MLILKKKTLNIKLSTPRTPEQNDVVERWNRTLVEAARTMLSASKLPLFFWAKAIAIAGGLDLVNPDIRLTMLNLGLTGNSFRGGEYGIAESTVNEYLTKIKNDSGPGIVKPLFEENIKFEFWGQCNEELKENIFYGKEDEDPHEHISNITKIIDIFHSPGVARDQVMLMAFSFTLKGKAKQ